MPAGRRRRSVDFLVALNQPRRSATSTTRCAWSPACRRRRRRSSRGVGSCRDSAWLLVALLRELGLAARFVSGYLVQLDADTTPLDGRRGPAAGLHRPARLGRGLPARRRLGRARPDLRAVRRRGPHPAAGDADPADARPDHRARRAVRGDDRVLQHRPPAPRGPARHAPYTDAQWAARSTPSGDAVDERLADGRRAADDGRRADLRRRSTTWTAPSGTSPPTATTSGPGHRARRAGWPSTTRPAALVHHGQGKWYPGEPLPRWQIGDHWRADGAAAVARPGLLADPWAPRRPTTPADGARRSPRAIAAAPGHRRRRRAAGLRGPLGRLSTRPGCRRRPARARRRRRAPSRRRPARTTIASAGDAAARRELRPRRRRTRPVGWVLPLHRARTAGLGHRARWRTPPRPARPDPGRLAARPAAAAGLDRLDAAAAGRPESRSPFDEPPAALPDVERRAWRPARDRRSPVERRADHGARASRCATGTSSSSCRRSTTFERRRRAARRRSRRAAAGVGVPVVLEGYPPPSDPRAAHARRSPPTPASSRSTCSRPRRGAELVEITDDARRRGPRRSASPPRSSPSTARHTGTGGGSHLTLGGADAGRQPAAAPARPAAQPAHLLAAPPVAVLPVLRPLHRPDQPGAAGRRGPPRVASTSSRSRSPRLDRLGAERRRRPWQVDRAAAPPAHRPHRQHPPGRVLHRQAVQPRLASGAGSGCSSCAASRCRRTRRCRWCRRCSSGARRPLLGASPTAAPLVRWGTELHDRFLLPAFVGGRHRRRRRRPRARHGIAVRDRVARAVPRVPLPAAGHRRRRPGRARAARGDRAVARARRGSGGRGHRSPRFVGNDSKKIKGSQQKSECSTSAIHPNSGVKAPSRSTENILELIGEPIRRGLRRG